MNQNLENIMKKSFRRFRTKLCDILTLESVYRRYKIIFSNFTDTSVSNLFIASPPG